MQLQMLCLQPQQIGECSTFAADVYPNGQHKVHSICSSDQNGDNFENNDQTREMRAKSTRLRKKDHPFGKLASLHARRSHERRQCLTQPEIARKFECMSCGVVL